ncbi:MAG TPA: RluA family pseudouridine synthase [Clostridiaceae bacterium]|nr:RluA family pseudouridine synthase [Clostridiaceae bacterium]
MTYVGEKIKTYLKESLDLSSRFLRNAALSKRIQINGKVVKLDYILREGDVLKISLVAKESQDITPENIPLDIVYEDEALLVVNKSPHMVVHPTKSYTSGTLSNAVMYHYQSKGEKTIIRLVSRLDMNTSGLLVLAKNQFVHAKISKDMKEETYDKYYVAIVAGSFPKDMTLMDFPIYRDPEEPYRRVVDPRGQQSLTKVQVLDEKNGYSVLLLQLLTGRTHQIRVHLSHLGYPILGDELYDGDLSLLSRQALHAVKLSFHHPVTDEKITVCANLPEDLSKVLEDLSLVIPPVEALPSLP